MLEWENKGMKKSSHMLRSHCVPRHWGKPFTAVFCFHLGNLRMKLSIIAAPVSRRNWGLKVLLSLAWSHKTVSGFESRPVALVPKPALPITTLKSELTVAPKLFWKWQGHSTIGSSRRGVFQSLTVLTLDEIALSLLAPLGSENVF